MHEVNPLVSERPAAGQSSDLISLLSQKVLGQSSASKAIVPYVYMYQSGLAPEGRPAGVFLLLGPTGTGKTKTVEAIAELLHGSEKKVLKIDCGEFQMEHEMAKLIGAPPGYLGHRETTPLITQQALSDVISENCDLALVLFDEIEKAAHSMTALLLGILDKGVLRLGDNTTVNLEKTLIFFTSNLGAREMMKEISPYIGFQSALPREQLDLETKLESIALGAVKKRFSPEFVNRIDAIVTYKTLDSVSLELILDHDMLGLQEHVNSRLGERGFQIEVLPESRQFLLGKGVSHEYGARELKRVIHRELTQPLATMVARGSIQPGSQVCISLSEDGNSLVMRVGENTAAMPSPSVVGKRPTMLIVDDNHDLLLFLASQIALQGWWILTAETAREARVLFAERRPDSVLVDYMLGEDDGFKLGLEFEEQAPQTQVILMTGGGLSHDELMLCGERDLPVLYKPFLIDDVLNLVKGQYRRVSTAAAA